jgi:mRNA-degrading endonuclease RelE of RelBE toxin-antitoxin system
MVYGIIISPTAQEDLKKFSPELQRRFFNKTEKLKNYPAVYGKPLRRPLAGRWELRFEKRWRIVYVEPKSSSHHQHIQR